MVGESCDDSCASVSHTGRNVWSSFAILIYRAFLLCHSDLALNEFEEERKVTYEPQDKNDMRA